ncbi:hypothetical protein [Klebsiella phage phiKp_21]|nr:hypothetical protein [Klebsiella phage phiKp_21]
MSNYSEYKKKEIELKEMVKTVGEELIQEMYEQFFEKHPEVKFVSTVGYIPGFNDGDACEFTSDTEFSGDYVENLSEESLEDMVIAFGGEPGEDDLFDLDTAENPNWNYQQYNAAGKDVDVDLLEKVYGYDWIVVAYKGIDGTVSIVQEDYDCGY